MSWTVYEPQQNRIQGLTIYWVHDIKLSLWTNCRINIGRKAMIIWVLLRSKVYPRRLWNRIENIYINEDFHETCNEVCILQNLIILLIGHCAIGFMSKRMKIPYEYFKTLTDINFNYISQFILLIFYTLHHRMRDILISS